MNAALRQTWTLSLWACVQILKNIKSGYAMTKERRGTLIAIAIYCTLTFLFLSIFCRGLISKVFFFIQTFLTTKDM
jgi:hypothetical protein